MCAVKTGTSLKLKSKENLFLEQRQVKLIKEVLDRITTDTDRWSFI